MTLKKLCKKAWPYLLPYLIALVVIAVVYVLLTHFLQWYGVWVLFLAWWGVAVYRGFRFLGKRFESGSILKEIEDYRIRAGLIALVVLPFLFILARGISYDVREGIIRNTDWKEVISKEMYDEVVPNPYEVEDYKVEKDDQGYYTVTLYGDSDGVEEDIVFYQEPKKVKKYGSLDCDPKWSAEIIKE